MSAEHGIDQSGKYVGDNDNQLKRIGVYFNEGQEGRQVLTALDGFGVKHRRLTVPCYFLLLPCTFC